MSGAGRIVMAHGGGGEATRLLLEERIVSKLGNPILDPLTDGAVLHPPDGPICFTTDSYVVRPLEFPGGDIGRLAVCGTVNDLAVMGARPLALSLGLILEEGLPFDLLDRIVDGVAAAAEEAGVPIVTGDTKVIERRGDDGMLINTAGVGTLREDARLGAARVEPGDALLISGRIAEHGLAVLSVRENLAFDTDIRSDAAPLYGLVDRLLGSGADVRFLRDPTRSGLAGVLADLAEETGFALEVEEEAIPITAAVLHTADLLGLDPLTIANEGKVVAVVAGADAPRALEALRSHPLGRRAAVIGRVTESEPPLVELLTRGGGRRLVQRPYGEDLPRIC
ncbi:MAG: hydrogenase expression/formation protein HypE [Candidatus Eisenbacteria bacterium]|nr:hydrogenase expression/formation protein HypE [Candidatus Eisenbacteria bacterium]